jgi:hypothetical protein
MRIWAACCLAVVVSAHVIESSKCSDGSGTYPTSPSLLQLAHKSLESNLPKQVDVCVVQDNQCFDKPFKTLSFEKNRQVEEDFDLVAANLTSSEFVKANLLKGEVEIVVTRFEEDVRWLDVFAEIPTTIYNRGPVDSFLPKARPNLRIIAQENKGREDQVMLNHMINRYDSLAAVTIFLQGWPFGHCPGLVDTIGHMLIKLFDKDKAELLRQSGIQLFETGHDGLIPLSAAFWQYSVDDGKLGLATDVFQFHHQLGDRVSAEELARGKYAKTCKTIMGEAECPKFQWVAEGAQWVVTRDRIRLQPKHVYERALSLGEGFEAKYRGLVLEALWPVLWSGSYWDPTAASEVMFDSDAGMANQRAHAQFHCHNRESNSEALLWSCFDRMGICEFNKQRSPPGQTELENKQYQTIRKHFDIQDETASTRWSVLAELKPSLGGSATFAPAKGHHRYFIPHIVESLVSDGTVQLEPVGPAPRDSLQFNISLSSNQNGEQRYIFAVNSMPYGPVRYLGCDRLTGDAKLVLLPYEWSVDFVWDGLAQLNSDFGQLNLRREDGGQLKCFPVVPQQQQSTSFLISPLVREL